MQAQHVEHVKHACWLVHQKAGCAQAALRIRGAAAGLVGDFNALTGTRKQHGVVTQSERRRLTFNRMDTDGDGQITKSEFKEARKDRRRMMREQGGHRGQGKGKRKGQSETQ